jgi:hypothetical protein
MQQYWQKLFEVFNGVLAQVWEQYGPFAVLLILLLIYHEVSTTRLWNKRLNDKDKEIERLVNERNVLHDIVLKNRISSEGGKDA